MTRGTERPTFVVLRRFGALAVIGLIVLAGAVAFGSRTPWSCCSMRKPASPPQVNAAGSIGAGWQNYDLIVSPGDWDGTADEGATSFASPTYYGQRLERLRLVQARSAYEPCPRFVNCLE